METGINLENKAREFAYEQLDKIDILDAVKMPNKYLVEASFEGYCSGYRYAQKEMTEKTITLDQAKQLVAERFSKENWESVVKDYDYALGISSFIGFEQIMEMVAETYKTNGLK